MTLVSYSSWSMLSSPIGRVEPSEAGGDKVCDRLDAFQGTTAVGEGLLSLSSVIKTRAEKRSRTRVTRIAKMEIPKTINPEFVFVPVKGTKSNLPVCFEELMNLFPCS
jgi:hypothetical protein